MEFNEHTPGRVFLGLKYLVTLAPAIFGEHAAQITEALENLERDGTLETVYRYVETRIVEPIAEQIKAGPVRADAELAAEVIEDQTVLVQLQIEDQAERSPGELAALEKDFERERQELEGKLDGLAKNYFDKHPDLSEDQRRDATETFRGIRDEAMGNLREHQETRLGELTRAQQEQREDLEERRKELEGTRAERS